MWQCLQIVVSLKLKLSSHFCSCPVLHNIEKEKYDVGFHFILLSFLLPPIWNLLALTYTWACSPQPAPFPLFALPSYSSDVLSVFYCWIFVLDSETVKVSPVKWHGNACAGWWCQTLVRKWEKCSHSQGLIKWESGRDFGRGEKRKKKLLLSPGRKKGDR